MPEIDEAAKGQGAGGEGGDAAAESNSGDGQDSDKGADQDQDAGDDADGDDSDADGDQDGKKGDDAKADEKKPKDDGSEPETRKRKTAKDYIIERKEKKLAKLEGKKADAKADDQDAAGDDDASDDSADDIDEEDEKIVEKVVSRKLAPLLQQQAEAEDNADIQAFLTANPDFAPYEAKARRFMKHESRANLPVQSIFYEVAGPDLMKIGAARAKAADVEARKSKTGGGGSRSVEGEKPVNEMSPDEFRQRQDAVRAKHGG